LFLIKLLIRQNDITIEKDSLGKVKLLLLFKIIPLFGLSLKRNPFLIKYFSLLFVEFSKENKLYKN
jgi:hypothetical protein